MIKVAIFQYVKQEIAMKNFKNIIEKPGFDYFQTFDCEGPNFDKNLKNNVLNLERFLKLDTEHNIYSILFITPYFAEMMKCLNLVEKIKSEYMVVFGLHIHPNNLPPEINKKCPFIKSDIDLISEYNLEEQKTIISNSYGYLKRLGIWPIEGFRGGYFSIDDNTEKALQEVTDIYFESHNINRREYRVKNPMVKQLPVYAKDDKEEFRLEYFNTEKIIKMLDKAKKENVKVTGITHSYLFDDNDFHYIRDKIESPAYIRLKELLSHIDSSEL